MDHQPARHSVLYLRLPRRPFRGSFLEVQRQSQQSGEPITAEALDFLRKDLAKVSKATPVIVAMHLCQEAITNRDELLEALGDSNVLLVLGGHYHQSRAETYKKIHFLQLPSPAPNGGGEFMVIRITSDRLVALPFSYRTERGPIEQESYSTCPSGGQNSRKEVGK